MKIGEVAAQAGVPIATVRYYERRGLIPEPPRTGTGYRSYGSEAGARLRFIKRAQDIGFNLEEVEELLNLRADDPSSCVVVEVKTRAKLAAVASKIKELERLQAALEKLASSCAARTPTTECPVLEMLIEEAGRGA